MGTCYNICLKLNVDVVILHFLGRLRKCSQKMKRREMLTGFGSGTLGLGIGTLLGCAPAGGEVRATNASASDPNLWKYATIDPQKAADLSYEVYPSGGCMYASVRALLETIADSLQSVDPVAASVVMNFPFHMMGYGRGGIGGTGSACGAFNGCAAVIGAFVKDIARQNAIIQELYAFCTQEKLPKYRPQDDRFPMMKTSVAESVLCHPSVDSWRAVAGMDIAFASPERGERCRRLTSDIVIKTAELLNRYHAE